MYGIQQLQTQKQVSKEDYRLFLETMAQLERYIEVAKYYWDWESRKWIHNNTIKQKDVISDSEKAEELFSNQLPVLSKKLEDMPSFFREELKEDFYRWIDTTGININNCPKRLRHFLFEINEVLGGHGERIKRNTENSKDNLDIEQMSKIFVNVQTSMQGEREIQRSLEGKFFYSDLELKKKLNADVERGKNTFKQIAKSIVNKHDEFHSFTQKSYQSSSSLNLSQIIQDLKINPQNWRLDEIPTEIDKFGRTKRQEWLLINRGAREDNFDQAGKLKFTNNSLYKWESFNAQQRFEIKKALKISVDYLTDEEIKWVFKENPRDWKVGKIEGQTYLVHNSARIRKEEIGTLIHSQQKFSEAEWREIEKALKNCFSTKKKSNFVSFANEEHHNIKDQDSKQNSKKDEEEKEWPTCKAISCDNEPDYWIDYCSYHQKCLDKLREYKSSINKIQELETFTTWFNGNCGYVINHDYSSSSEHPFYIWIVVYEPVHKGISETLKTFVIKDSYDNLENAKNKTSSLRNELNGENPILYIHPNANSYASFSELTRSPYVIKIDLPYESKTRTEALSLFSGEPCRREKYLLIGDFVEVEYRVPNENPENYLKPLDVVWVRKVTFPGVRFYHVGIYLGNDKFCHFSSERKSRETNRTIITDWETFVEGCVNGEIFSYHPVIPFKHYELVIKQIDWARTNNYDKGWYCLPNNNCEHHANSFVFGIDYSQQVKEREPLFWPKRCKVCDSCRREIINNGKGSTIKLTNEIKETNGELGKNTGSWYKEIKDQYETKTVVPPKDCKIM